MITGGKKKILYIQTSAGGGALIALYEMVKILDRKKFEPVIFCYEKNSHTASLIRLNAAVIFFAEKKSKPANEQPQPVTRNGNKIVIRIAGQLKKLFIDDVRMARHITKVIKEHQIDIIHHNIDFPSARQGIIANLKTRLPQVCHYRSLKDQERFSFNWFVDRYLAKKVNYHIYISNAVKLAAEKYLGNVSGRGKVVRDIIDIRKFKPEAKDNRIENEFGLQQNQKVICCIGRIVRWKGQHVFIEAFARVVKDYPAALALIVGPFEDGVGDYEYYKILKQQVNDFDLQKQVIFTGNRQDIPALMSVSDCIVHSSITPEPQGLVIVEALINKKPVIVTDAGGAAELVVNNEGGIKVSPGNAIEMAEAICKVLAHKNRFIGEDLPAIIKKDFNPQQQIQCIELVYEQLLRPASQGRNL